MVPASQRGEVPRSLQALSNELNTFHYERQKVKTMKKTQLWKRPGAVTIFSILLLTGLFVRYVSGTTTSPGTALATPSSGFTSTIVGPTRFDEIDVKTKTADHEGEDRKEPARGATSFGETWQARIKTEGLSDVYIVTNKVIPGGQSGWHTHPGPSVVSVKSGTATVYDGDDPDCTPHFYPAGTGFIDSGGGHVHLVRNEGSVDLELVAFQIIPLGAQRRIDAPSPGHCPF
jgi:hypothetical protein